MKWRYEVTGAALKDLKRLDPPIARRILEALKALAAEFEENADQARLGHVKKLAGQDGEYRLRVGDFRVRYGLERRNDGADESGVIVVYVVRHRREAYD